MPTTPSSSATSTAPARTSSIPEGMHSITAHLVCAGAADAIAFYAKAFGAKELFRLQGPDGKIMNASIVIGDSRIMLVDEYPLHGMNGPKALNGTPVTLHLQVPNADAAFDTAVKAGATVKMPLNDMFWGDRYGVVIDPFGHQWSIAHRLADLTAEEIHAAAMKACAEGSSCGDSGKA